MPKHTFTSHTHTQNLKEIKVKLRVMCLEAKLTMARLAILPLDKQAAEFRIARDSRQV